MKVYAAEQVRNVALVGHSGSGKTQLAAALLFDAGMVNRLGKVDEGNTVTDFDEEEIARKHTLSSSVAFAEWNRTKINFIDTPGVANFLSDTRAAMRVTDAAALIVDAVAGVEVQTEKVWNTARDEGAPCLIVLNRLDRERASLDRSLASLREAFGREIVPIQLPIGEEKSFEGIVDLVRMQAVRSPGEGDKPAAGDIPPALADAAATARDSLIEMVAEADDDLMEKFFDAGTLSQEELEQGLRSAVRSRRIFPLVCTSALANIGVQPLLDAVTTYLPSAADRPLPAVARDGGEPVAYDADDSDRPRRSCGRRSPIRSPAGLRCSAWPRARWRPMRRCGTRRRGRRSAWAAWRSCRARRRTPSRA